MLGFGVAATCLVPAFLSRPPQQPQLQRRASSPSPHALRGTAALVRGTAAWATNLDCRREVAGRCNRLTTAVAAKAASDEDPWKEAVAAERSRSELLLEQLSGLQGAFTEKQLEEEAANTRRSYEACAIEWSADGFEELKGCNDALEQGIQNLKGVATKATSPSVTSWTGTRLAGMEFDIDIMSPVSESNELALVAGAPHVRCSLPLSDNGSVMWGSDLTPFFDESGDRLMAFIAFLPLGMNLKNAPRPVEAPVGQGDAVVVDAVAKGSEAEVAGIKVGDYVRAVSLMGAGFEPTWFEKLLGAEAVPLKSVMKVDGLPAKEVIAALESNTDSPDGLATVTLLLERPP